MYGTMEENRWHDDDDDDCDLHLHMRKYGFVTFYVYRVFYISQSCARLWIVLISNKVSALSVHEANRRGQTIKN